MNGGFNYIDINFMGEAIGDSMYSPAVLDVETFKKLRCFYDSNDKPLIVDFKHENSLFSYNAIFICNKINLKFGDNFFNVYFGGISNDTFNQFIGLIIDNEKAGIFGKITL